MDQIEAEKPIIWAPQYGPQKQLIDCPFTEVFFGGARGGGKTDGVLGKWAIKESQYGHSFNAIMFRRTTVSSEDAIDRSRQIYGPIGGKFNESKLIWKMPHGGRVAFAYLDTVADADEYQGRNVSDTWVEEAGQYPDSKPIDRLYGVLRSAASVPIQLILTGNPGGSGQHWLSQRYGLIPFPDRPKIVSRTLENGSIHRAAVIPSRITDNQILLHSDPEYINRLHLVGSSALVKAWLHGDWTAVEGAFFDCWHPARHVVPAFEIPDHWMRFRSGDWGSAKPFSIGWWAVVSDTVTVHGLTIPRGCLVRYREWYGMQKDKPNTGLKLTAEEVAAGIADRERQDPKISYGVLDPSAFAEDGGPSIAERMFRSHKIMWQRADNKRVGGLGALGGWDQMRARLKGDEDGPMAVCLSNCVDSIRTIPVLQHDLNRIEDLDTEAEDHAADDWRYGCMSRPYIRPQPKSVQPIKPTKHYTIDELIKYSEREPTRRRI